MDTHAFHTSLALISYLSLLVPRIAIHDPNVAQTLRRVATSIAVHVANDRMPRAHKAAYHVFVLLTAIETWAYVPPDDLAEAQDTASHLIKLTASA